MGGLAGIATITEATIVCPRCGHAELETMPTDACRYFYDCASCGTTLKPLPGDFCVFCSYADPGVASAVVVDGSKRGHEFAFFNS